LVSAAPISNVCATKWRTAIPLVKRSIANCGCGLSYRPSDAEPRRHGFLWTPLCAMCTRLELNSLDDPDALHRFAGGNTGKRLSAIIRSLDSGKASTWSSISRRRKKGFSAACSLTLVSPGGRAVKESSHLLPRVRNANISVGPQNVFFPHPASAFCGLLPEKHTQ